MTDEIVSHNSNVLNNIVFESAAFIASFFKRTLTLTVNSQIRHLPSADPLNTDILAWPVQVLA